MDETAEGKRFRLPRWTENRWIAVPAAVVAILIIVWAALAAGGVAAGVLRWMQCIGKETLLCGQLAPMPMTTPLAITLG